jgi:hypothetical protein
VKLKTIVIKTFPLSQEVSGEDTRITESTLTNLLQGMLQGLEDSHTACVAASFKVL